MSSQGDKLAELVVNELKKVDSSPPENGFANDSEASAYVESLRDKYLEAVATGIHDYIECYFTCAILTGGAITNPTPATPTPVVGQGVCGSIGVGSISSLKSTLKNSLVSNPAINASPTPAPYYMTLLFTAILSWMPKTFTVSELDSPNTSPLTVLTPTAGTITFPAFIAPVLATAAITAINVLNNAKVYESGNAFEEYWKAIGNQIYLGTIGNIVTVNGLTGAAVALPYAATATAGTINYGTSSRC